MAHFAQIDSDNKVTQIIVVSNNEILDENGDEQESLGIEFCKSLFGESTTWVQTSYNKNFRGNFAEVNGEWDEENDIFKPHKAYDSWVWDADSLDYVPPTDPPAEYRQYGWNENLYNSTGDGWEELYHYPVWVQNKIWVWNIDLQVFEAVQPYPSWTQNENGLWTAPVAYPDSGDWEWSERNQQWEEYTE